jgi:hypothetical protein
MSLRKSLLFVTILVGMFVMNACKDINESSPVPGMYASSYFSFAPNTVLKYDGDSIIFNDFNNSIDTVEFYYTDSLIQIETIDNQIIYQFDRYLSYDGLEYVYLKSYSLNNHTNGVIRTEDLSNNYLLPYLFSKDSKWNGNQYQLGSEIEYSIDSMATIDLLGAQRKLLKVKQVDEENLIREDKVLEYYTQGLGMSRRYSKNVDKELVTKKIKSGSIVNLVLKP